MNPFRQRLQAAFGREVEVISTVDHPAVSPPERVLSSHHLLHQLDGGRGRVLALVWDGIDIPDNGTRRAAVSLDLGFLANRDADLEFFAGDGFFPRAWVQRPDLSKQRAFLEAVVEQLTDVPCYRREANKAALLRNYDQLRGLYEGAAVEATDGTNLYRAALAGLYELFGVGHLAEFVRSQSCSAYGSDGLREYVAYCLEETAGAAHGLGALLGQDGVILRRPFRSTGGAAIEFVPQRLGVIAQSIRRGEALYSAEVFFWCLALAGVRHFGNDYGCFERLARHPALPGAAELQITHHHEDSFPLYHFAEPRSFRCEYQDGLCVVTSANKIKDTRIDTLPAAYLHLGPAARQLTPALLDGFAPRPHKLTMGRAR